MVDINFASKYLASISILFIIFLFICIQTTSNGAENNLKPAGTNPGLPVKVKTDSQFILKLESNITTGYKWELAKPLDEKLISLIKSTYIDPEKQIPGAGGMEEWTFNARKAGKTTISFKYARPWEKDKPPAKSLVFTIIIK